MDANTHWARIVPREDGALVVFETVAFDPAGRFDPALRWEPCPAGTPQGATYDPKTKAFANPSPPPEPDPAEPDPPAEPTSRTLVSVARFKLMFGQEARVAMQLARNYVPADPAAPDMDRAKLKAALDILFESLDDLTAAQEPVDILDPDVVKGVDFIASVGFITAEHAETIKRGLPGSE